MLQQIMNSWKDNRGNLLLLLGACAGVLMSVVWYFKLIPEITLVGRGLPSTLISSSSMVDPNPLVALIRAPGLPTDQSFPDAHVVVEVYPSNEALTQQLSPLYLQAITLPTDGRLRAVVFNNLSPGQYAAVAYIDINDNGRFDVDEKGTFSEPFRLAHVVDASPRDEVAADNGDEDVSQEDPSTEETERLPDGIFELRPGQANLIQFSFN